MEIKELYQIYLSHPEIQTDTRKIKSGQLFFALKGENFNGNAFASIALKLGAAFCVVDEETGLQDDRIIKVDDVLLALQNLAKMHREQFAIPFIAITGSNGKTTTKELIHAVLSTTFKTYTTEGNLNNHIGIPLTILKIKKEAEIAVIEMGANHQKEIEEYCKYAQPTHGLITNCGKAHLEGFGGELGVRKGKGELYDFIKGNSGTVFVCSDYDYLMEMSRALENKIYYGSTSRASSAINMINGVIDGKEKSMLNFSYNTHHNISGYVKTHLVGDYNLPNVLAACCIGFHFGVKKKWIENAIENYIPSNSRSQLLEKEGNNIILDAYNANPSSMKLAIENFAKMPGERKILMLGGMMELGEDSENEHRKLLDLIDSFTWEHVVIVGNQFEKIKGNHTFFIDSEQASQWYKTMSFKGVSILLKGSRCMKMEKVID